jgi:hypothetical protein
MTNRLDLNDDTDDLETATSTAATDTAVPDDQEPHITGDSGILLGFEATTIARNESLAEQVVIQEERSHATSDAGRRSQHCPGRRGPLRRR